MKDLSLEHDKSGFQHAEVIVFLQYFIRFQTKKHYVEHGTSQYFYKSTGQSLM